MDGSAPRSEGSFWLALALFLIGVAGAVVALVAALVIWLGERLGSMVVAAVTVALFLLLIASISYLLSLREAVRRLGARLDGLCRLSEFIERGYSWVRRWLEGP